MFIEVSGWPFPEDYADTYGPEAGEDFAEFDATLRFGIENGRVVSAYTDCE